MSYYINLLSSTQIHDRKFLTPEHVFSYLDLKAQHVLNNSSFTTIHRSSYIFHNNIFFIKKTNQYFTLALLEKQSCATAKLKKLIHFLHPKFLLESFYKFLHLMSARDISKHGFQNVALY